MDKNIIKAHLSKRFLSEEATPGIKVTAAAQKESGKINKAGVKAVEKDVTAYDKNLKQKDKNDKTMGANKFNYTDDAEKTYHDELEIMNGQEMIEYNSEPGKEFTDKAIEAIEGSSRMGNEKGGNAEEAWGASSDDFGKDFVKRIKSSAKKRADSEIQTYGMGDVQIPTNKRVQTAQIAVNEDLNIETPEEKNTRIITGYIEKHGEAKAARALINKELKAIGIDPMGLAVNNTFYSDGAGNIEIMLSDGNYRKAEMEAGGVATQIGQHDSLSENKESNNEIIKESSKMKRLKFKQPFNGIGKALTLIPEAYRTDNKEFEMTDGNETYRIRWEGTLTEGRAIVITASDKKMVNEDMAKMKHLMGYKSQDTLGLVKGNARIDENAKFGDIWGKTKVLLEGNDIESAKVKKAGDLDDAVKHAPEAKKHVEGSVSKDKGTQAPAAKDGSMESLDDAVNHAPEAKKHVEGSVSTEKGTKAPAPKKGEWENVKKSAPEASKHVTMKESINEEESDEHEAEESTEFEAGEQEEKTEVTTEVSEKGTVAPAPKKGHWEDINVPHAAEAKKHVTMNESMVENEEEEDEIEDTFNNQDDEDDSLDIEPTNADVSSEIPSMDDDDDEDDDVVVPTPSVSTILFSPSTGAYWIKTGDINTKVPDKYLGIASDKSMKGSKRADKIAKLMQGDDDFGNAM